MIDKIHTKQRIHYLDSLRVLACMFVLLLHANNYRFSEMANSSSGIIYFIIVAVSSKLFFMVSGALLLPLKRPDREFVVHRLKTVLIPLAIWSCLYLFELYFIRGVGAGEMKRHIASILFTPVEPVLWFVYAMAGFYLLMPIISKCLLALGKRYIEYYLILWLASSIIPYIDGLFFTVEAHHTALASINNFLGYIVLGYYLHNWELPIFKKKYMWWTISIFILCVILPPLFAFHFQKNFMSHDSILQMVISDLGINTIMLGIFFFTIFQHFVRPENNLFNRIMANLSVVTFGVYLFHMFLFRNLLWPWAESYLHLPIIATSILLACIAMALSYCLFRLLYILPFSKYIIGH